MSRETRPWPWLIVLSAFAVGAVSAAGDSSPIRTVLAVWFLLLCPGLALVGLMRLNDVWGELTLGVAISVALDTVVAAGLLYAGLWSPPAAFAILAAVSLAGAGFQYARGGGPAGAPS
ncbi:MAG: hypothetical protein H0U84_08630 [Thermoleophilaceae bacterium]|nr:hypothetical protein [Thermoleophilaceae bacterium]